MNHPMQPIVTEEGTKRFKENKIVRYLLDNGRVDMNKLARIPFDQEARAPAGCGDRKYRVSKN